MRFVFFDFTINFGGGPQGSVYLAERLNGEHEVIVLDAYGSCAEYCGAVEEAGLRLQILYPKQETPYIGYAGRPFRRFLRGALQVPEFLRIRHRLRKALLELKPDVVWVNNYKSLFFVGLSGCFSRCPVVVYFRGWGTPDQMNPVFVRLLKGPVSAVVAHARATVEQLARQGVPREKLHYAPNTVNFDTIVRNAAKPLDEPKPNGNGYPKILLPAARPVREKGHLTALSALVRLKNRGYEPVLWLPGKTATGADPSFIRQMEGFIREKNLETNVQFLGWRTDMEALVHACDVVILPSHTEGFPRIILEAMLLKKPVIATGVGGIPETLIHEQTGIMIDVDDEEGLAEGIVRYAEDAAFRERIVRQAYTYVCEHHHPDKHTQKVIEVFESVCRERKGLV